MNHMMLPTAGKLIACELIWFDLATPYDHTNVSDCLVGRQIKINLFTADCPSRHTVEVRIRKVTRRDVLVQAKPLQSEALRGRQARSPAGENKLPHVVVNVGVVPSVRRATRSTDCEMSSSACPDMMLQQLA